MLDQFGSGFYAKPINTDEIVKEVRQKLEPINADEIIKEWQQKLEEQKPKDTRRCTIQ